jgi:hypothetical protein
MPSFSPLVTAVLGGVLVVVGLVLLDRLALWAERRGWVSFRRRKASSGSVNASLKAHALLEPGREHLLAARAEAPDAEAESGDPATAGGVTSEEPEANR